MVEAGLEPGSLASSLDLITTPQNTTPQFKITVVKNKDQGVGRSGFKLHFYYLVTTG